MKPDNRTAPTPPTREQGPRVAVAPAPATTPAATGSLADSHTIEEDLQAIAREEEALRKRRDARRKEYWSVSLANVTRIVEQLVTLGFERAEIGKALGFSSNAKSTSSAKKAGGPKTHDGWYALYFTSGVQSYVKTRPDLAATFKASGVARDQYRFHIPPADLKVIEATARQKAHTKFPQVTPSSHTTTPEIVTK